MSLPSIKDLTPIETGGRIARNGFVYQDHVGVQFLLDMLYEEEIQEVWFEGEDDIVLHRVNSSSSHIEMVQVKSNDLDSRWSVSKLFSLELLPKSLARGRCKEDIIYRIITATDVDSGISFLKNEIGSNNRNNSNLDTLLKPYLTQINKIGKNPKGEDAYSWFNKCFWEVFHSQDTIKYKNLSYLEKCLNEKFNTVLPPDQKLEIYQQLLAFVSNAGVGNEKNNFTKEEICDKLDHLLNNLSAPKQGSKTLDTKLIQANLEPEVVLTAKEFRWQFQKESLNFNFYNKTQITAFKNKIHLLIQDLKLRFDDGEFQFTDIQFHNYCRKKVIELANEHKIEQAIALGCMYDNTSRCTHRFTKAKA
ncbi:dsDNA nuclease domain-containing protein [Rufibacter sediminis]|uniref:DUF4297 domain-containing protein n=1 Tax=Rufibacter sediminis TaxID=2762756 RepID=A0ABR6VT89_9BACT|nr:dsDNA nuclease domain-containing protein [Rufibacter sediminis]MBC3540423.1 DUF4297 domain-containing protein [Rufibacter sediminis]